ncbi:MAG: TolC family protein [Tenuifilaceae bacterium]|nr:TolC family protein [Tenuifilaceae bacterium]
MLKLINPRTTLFFIAILIANLSFSQGPWNLEQCISYALENNIQIKQQELNVRLSENQLTRSKFNTLPNLNVNGGHNYSFGRSTNFITNQKERIDIQSTNASISSQVTLFNGLQLLNTQRRDAIDLMANLTDVEKIKNNISLNIAAAYLQILFSNELLETAKKQKELSQLQVNRTKQLVDAGSLPEGNLLEIEAQLASDELQIVNNQNQLDIAYLSLAQILDLKSTEGFTIEQPNLKEVDDILPADNSANIFEQASAFIPQIASAQYRVQSAEKGVLIAKGARSLRLSLGASYGTGAQKSLTANTGVNNPFWDQIKDNANTNIGLSISVPIFNGLQVKTSISNAHISLENARYNLELEKNMLFKDIQQAYADALGAYKKYKATEKNVVALQEAFQYAEQRFNVGLVNSLDYTTSKTRLSKAQTDLLSAKYELVFKSKILDFYRGNPLSL